jgi:hypothetical protein
MMPCNIEIVRTKSTLTSLVMQLVLLHGKICDSNIGVRTGLNLHSTSSDFHPAALICAKHDTLQQNGVVFKRSQSTGIE